MASPKSSTRWCPGAIRCGFCLRRAIRRKGLGLRRYLVPLTAGLLGLGAVVGLVAATIANMEDGARGQHLLEAGLRAQALLSRLRDAETGQRGYLLTGRESYLEPFRLVRDGVGP